MPVQPNGVSCFDSRSPEETHAAGRALGRAFAELEAQETQRGGPALVVALQGPLGAGKTGLVKGIAAGLGIDPAGITSPTFVIAGELEAPAGLRLVHADLYRVESAEELEAAGLRDWLAADLVAVEWADRIPGALPRDRIEIDIARGESADARCIRIAAGGPRAERLRARWSACAGAGGGEESGTWR